MTTNSTYGKYIYVPASETSSNRPLSARKMVDLTNNLQYLLDSSAQQRICWARPNNADAINVDSVDYALFMTIQVSWGWMTASDPFAAYIMVTGQANGTPLDVTAVIHHSSIDPTTRDADVDDCIYSIDGYTAVSSDTSIISALSELRTEPNLGSLAANKRAYAVPELDDDGVAITRVIDHPEFRFTIWAKGEGWLNQIQLREYCK